MCKNSKIPYHKHHLKHFVCLKFIIPIFETSLSMKLMLLNLSCALLHGVKKNANFLYKCGLLEKLFHNAFSNLCNILKSQNKA